MNNKWVKNNWRVVYILGFAALLMAILAGMAQFFTGETRSLSSFLGSFILALAFQGAFIIAVFISIASDHPRFASLMYLLIFLVALSQYPSTPVGGVSEELMADYPLIGLTYILGLGLYILAAGIVLFRSFKRQTPLKPTTILN
jgi:hypothetical protein